LIRIKLIRQPYFVSELEAGAIYPRRVSEPDEVANGVIFLIENAMMNDFELRIDGGWRGGSNWAGPKDREHGGTILDT
jgi:3-hydroxyacyl-CoA dehydrogenase